MHFTSISVKNLEVSPTVERLQASDKKVFVSLKGIGGAFSINRVFKIVVTLGTASALMVRSFEIRRSFARADLFVFFLTILLAHLLPDISWAFRLA